MGAGGGPTGSFFPPNSQFMVGVGVCRGARGGSAQLRWRTDGEGAVGRGTEAERGSAESFGLR